MRVTLRLREAMSGDASKSHLGDKSALWKKIRSALVVNPDSGTGAVLPLQHRFPQPASREELYTMPSSKASDIAANSYSKRDFRRMYPSTVMLDQDNLTTLLLAQADGFTSLPAPATSLDPKSTALTADSPAPTLSSLYAVAPLAKAAFRPPTPPGAKYRWNIAREAIPHDPESDFPMWNASAEKI